jgi:hypothetical protein
MPMLLVPVHAPWMRVAEAVDYARAHTDGVAVAVHDGLLNDNGRAVVGNVLGGLLEKAGKQLRWVSPGADV